MYRILAFDGGGIRGMFSLILVDRIDRQRPGWIDGADLIAGTSIGGIIALGLASGMEIPRMQELLVTIGKRIFTRQSYARRLMSSSLSSPRYSSKPLEEELEKHFQDKRLCDIEKGVMLTSFMLDNKGAGGKRRSWGPKIFHNLDPVTGDPDVRCVDAALYTSAAPTYFPSRDGFVDGGVTANNPSMCAYALARNTLRNEGMDDDIALLSIGTGEANSYIDANTEGWGSIEWSKVIIPLLTDGPAKIADYQMRAMLGRSYMRLNAAFDGSGPIGLDDIHCLRALKEAAESYDISPALEWLDSTWLI